ncbi:hypothetical protein AXI76_gp004 [Pseudoalteromonas phage H101]|uniref:Uncharacterized protein n=1 Tax=Pseudoalteromonas phage H101 TaxID=1654919 RepID=A0A0H4J1Y6_9CAUD|nr:hypothetical protein AXI76_gp004 [Pseudoalteromonas phage H101]AKO60905.1 hypothetical protein [Pseudoalteromonas phage H101]
MADLVITKHTQEGDLIVFDSKLESKPVEKKKPRSRRKKKDTTDEIQSKAEQEE